MAGLLAGSYTRKGDKLNISFPSSLLLVMGRWPSSCQCDRIHWKMCLFLQKGENMEEDCESVTLGYRMAKRTGGSSWAYHI